VWSSGWVRGGIGAVYAVVDGASGKRLALKQLLPHTSSAAAALFEREYHTQTGLKHPCIVEVYDYGSDALGATSRRRASSWTTISVPTLIDQVVVLRRELERAENPRTGDP
jgi:serine/threonine protein kinase